MADRIYVVPAELRQAAGYHQETSDYLRAIPLSNNMIQESLESLGPIFSELSRAGSELLEERRQCYEQQADEHGEMAHNLYNSANIWEQHEQEAAAKLRRVVGDSR